MRRKITKRTVDALMPGQMLADSEVRGFVARRLASGVVTYGLRYRTGGVQRWLALGLHGRITPDTARRLAKKYAGAIASGSDPARERSTIRQGGCDPVVDDILDMFLERHVRRRLRRASEVERSFQVYVRPRIGRKVIYEVRRSDIATMLDEIEDRHGPVMADRVLAYVRKAFNWQSARDDRFVPPIVRGMTRTSSRALSRTRVLSDREIQNLWRAADLINSSRPYANYLKVLLLTAQRPGEVAGMVWQEISNGIWTIPATRRAKGGANTVPLTEMALNALGKHHRKGFVFSTTNGRKPFAGFSKAKRSLDAALASMHEEDARKPMEKWRLHDLRRTARSLMSRAGVEPDVAERVLGHAIPGVRGIYDLHDYETEKRDALERLSRLVQSILLATPKTDVSSPLPFTRRRRQSASLAPNEVRVPRLARKKVVAHR